jgi:hypothetical protein
MVRFAQMMLGLILGVGCRSVESRPGQPGEVPATASESIGNRPPSAAAGSAGAATSPNTAKFGITKSNDEITGEMKLRITQAVCDLEVVVKPRGSELIVVRYGNCRLGPDDYAAAWRQVLASAMHESRFVGSKIHLVWRRIASPESDSMAPLMSRRLASAARNDSRWDAKRGTVKKGSVNALVLELARPSQVFPELVRVAESLGFSVQTEYIEKVLAGTAEQLPGGASGEFSPKEKLPYDAQIGFVLDRLPI